MRSKYIATGLLLFSSTSSAGKGLTPAFDFSSLQYEPIVIITLLFILCLLALLFIVNRIHQLKLHKLSHENELLLDDLINNQPSGIYRIAFNSDQYKPSMTDAELLANFPLQYTYTNRQHENITGLKHAELTENPAKIIYIVHPEDRDNFVKENRNSMERIRKFTWEGRLIVAGTTKWVRFDSVPRLNPPEIVIWTGTIADISAQKFLEGEMVYRENFERLITKLSSNFLNISAANVDNILDKALEKIGAFCKADRAYLFLVDHEKQTASNTHEWCNQEIEPQKAFLANMAFETFPMWMEQLLELQPIVVNQVSELGNNWKAEKEILTKQDIKSVMAAPVVANNKLFGFVGFDSVKTTHKWREFEVKLLSVFADMIYNALEKVKYEQTIVESRSILRTVLDTIKVRVFWKDTKLVFKGCNKAFAEDAGYSDPEEIIGLDDTQMVWNVQAEKFREDDRKVISSKKPFLNFVEQQTDSTGRTKWVSTSKIPLFNNMGKVTGVLGTYQDITTEREAEIALKKSEKRYRILTENAFDGIYMIHNHKLEFVNQRFCELTGFSFDELTHPGFDPLSIFTAENMDEAIQRKKNRMEGDLLPSTYEMEIKTKQGDVKNVEISTNQLTWNEDDFFVLGIMRDITERKNNEKLRNEIAVANQSAIFKQNFLANMSHEIRTPLTGVLGMIEILSQTGLTTLQADYINTLRISTENLREIINQILDYSKIEAGEMHLKNVVFETKTIFDNAQKLYQSTCNKDVKLTINISEEIPRYIEADEKRLTQIINNLLSNAIKFTQKGEISIKASITKWIDSQTFVMKIEVKDTGIGIRPEAQAILFKPFGQIDNQDKRHFDGTGLGLVICKELTQLMGGNIGIKSETGKGSKFWFTFKARKIVVVNADPDRITETSELTTPGLNILYAEDKIINQKVVSLIFRGMGHRVTMAENGAEVLKIFKPNTFDLILMDIQMPVMDGITATQQLRKDYSDLPPIVGLSANAFEGDREKYIMQGLDDYLTKPINTDELKQTIEKLTLHRRNQQESN